MFDAVSTQERVYKGVSNRALEFYRGNNQEAS